MLALVYHAYGTPAVLSLEELEKPRIADNEVLVRVQAASVNSWDRDNLLGAFPNRAMLGWQRPKVHVLGGDIAGRVEQVGSAVTRWKPGDEVLGDLCNSGWGAFAQYARAPENVLVAKPIELSFQYAAALPQAAVMALQGIRDHGAVSAGQRVLINGAGGGVGSFAVQLAKLYGAEVTGVDSEPKLGLVSELGADHVIDYRTADYAVGDRRYDFILDCELHRSALECRRVLAPEGKLTVLGGSLPRILQTFLLGRWLAGRRGQQMSVLTHEPNKNLAQLVQLAANGSIRPAIERVYALDEAPQALQRMCDGLVLGKAVIDLS
jgi:NADPH:quinone reductase-like Zn-dependent oxidoreductase